MYCSCVQQSELLTHNALIYSCVQLTLPVQSSVQKSETYRYLRKYLFFIINHQNIQGVTERSIVSVPTKYST